MRKKPLFLTAVLATMLLAQPTFCQVCGDANGDGNANIGDIAYILNYTALNGAPPVVPEDAELDHRDGITFSDAATLADYMFWSLAPFPYTCGVTGTYSFAPASSDTVFLPRMLGIPDGIDSVQLPVTTSFETDLRGYYLPLLRTGSGSNDAFSITGIANTNEVAYSSIGSWIADTLVLFGVDFNRGEFAGKHNLYTLTYNRVNPGTGDIVTELTDRNALWRYAIEKNGDLFRPVVVYEDIILAPETLLVSLTELSFTATAGKPSRDTFTVEFTSSSIPISFNLTLTDPWIIVEPLPPEGLVTPATVTVTADATQVGIGNYTGEISIVDLDPPAPTTTDAIDIYFTVNEPGLYPSGDFDCDGIVDISDLTILIFYLFLDGDPPTPCD